MSNDHPAVPHPNANYAGMTHAQLKALVDNNNDPGSAYRQGDQWHDLAGKLGEAAITLDAAINGSQAHWEGAAADLARAHLAKVRDWSNDTSQYYTATGNALHQQVDAAAKAKSDMPNPVDFDPMKMLEQAATNPVALVMLPVTMAATANASNSAKDKAIQVIQARDNAMQAASASIPAFSPPPDLGSGGTSAPTPTGTAPSGYGASVAGYSNRGQGGGGAGAPGHYTGGHGGPGYVAPQPGGPGGGHYTPQPIGASGPTQLQGYTPPMNPGGGYTPPPTSYNPGPNPGGFGPGGGGPVVGGFGYGGGGGDSYGSGSGRMGPGSTAAAGTERPAPGSTTSAGSVAAEDSGAMRGGMGMTGAPGASGVGGAGGAAGRGEKEEDKAHKRPTFLVETDDVFGEGQMVAPTVIGENPTGGW